MTIHQEIPIALKLEYYGQYMGGLIDSKFNMTPLKGNIDNNEIISAFEFASEIKSLEDNFVLNAVVRIAFIITEKKHIDNNDCVDMMKLAIDYLKKLINTSVYPSLETIDIPYIEKDVLNDSMNTFLVEMNALGHFGS